MQNQSESNRYAKIASLVADWYWQLDRNLCYVFHEGAQLPLTTPSHASLIGTSRVDDMSMALKPNASLAEHNRLLSSHLPLDLTLQVDRNDKGTAFIQIVAQPIHDEQGQFQGYYGCERDVTERAHVERQLEHLANHDELTGIFNRRAFQARLKQLQQFVQSTDYEFSLCVLDLDRFKIVNDTAGHAAGDQLLVELVNVLEHYMMPGETLARIGGDEFSLLLESPVEEAATRAMQMIQGVSNYVFDWDGRHFSVGASVGITSIKHMESDEGDMLKRADSACYAAKNNGRNQCIVFAHDSENYLAYRAELQQLEIIKEALRANRLRLFMQPIEPTAGIEARPHYEILLRLESEYGELMLPATFIPVAERFQIMQDLDIWVVQNCLKILDTCRSADHEISLSINLSGNTLSDLSALNRIVETVLDSSVAAALLCFEITESAAISNIDTVVVFMNKLKGLGVRFALDDFGAGLSSFGYIRSLPIDYLKIDGYFIRNIRSDSTNRAITAAFVQLSRDLGIATVAESVEDKATRKLVRKMGIDYVQGYGVARPIDVDQALIGILSNSRNMQFADSFALLANNPG